MDIKEIQQRNYKATVKRGFINQDTSIFDFITKIEEEVNELEYSHYLRNSTKIQFDKKELADIILVCLAMAKHYDIDIMKAMEEKTIFNEIRKY
jgi:NTP pyrophosphatase (non-canonical NTP hydrolase)